MTVNCAVVVLGVGTSGEDSALRLARAGLDVVGIEKALIGGECPYWACLPTKSLARSASLLAEARRANGLVGRVDVDPDWSTIAARLRAEVTGGWDDSGAQARFEAEGGRILRGQGRVVAPHTVRVGDTEVVGDRGVLVATGSSPVIPPIPGLADVPYWTTHEAVEAETLPASLVVLGGGAVGCELGQVFARFGVDVTIVEGRERLLPAAEPEASRLVEDALRRDGINVRSGTLATGVHSDGDGVMVHLDSGDTVRAQTLLLALGRRADAESLGVTSAGARTNHGFIVVDEQLRAAEGMWAIGDVTGRGLLTEVAVYQGLLAVEDILGKHPPRADYSAVPITVFTDPEFGSVGLTEQAARDQGHDVAVTVKDVQATFRGWLHRVGGEGTIKLVVDCEQDRLLGATVVGPRASDVLGFLAIAVQARVPVSRLGTMIYAFPTFYGGIGEAIGAYGRGLVRALDPDARPLLDDG